MAESKNPGTCENCQKLVPRRYEMAFGQGDVCLSGLWCAECVRGMLPPETRDVLYPTKGETWGPIQ